MSSWRQAAECPLPGEKRPGLQPLWGRAAAGVPGSCPAAVPWLYPGRDHHGVGAGSSEVLCVLQGSRGEGLICAMALKIAFSYSSLTFASCGAVYVNHTCKILCYIST